MHNKRVSSKHIDLLRQISIKRRLVLLFVMQIVVLIITAISISYTLLRDTTAAVEAQNGELLAILSTEFDEAISTLENTSAYFLIAQESYSESDTITFLQEEGNSITTLYYSTLNSTFLTLSSMYSSLTTIAVYDATGSGYLRRNDLQLNYSSSGWWGSTAHTVSEDEEFFQETAQTKGAMLLWNSTDIPDSLYEHPTSCLFATRAAYSIQTHSCVGVILVGADLSNAVNYFNENANSDKDIFFVLDEDNQYVWGNAETTELLTTTDTKIDDIQNDQMGTYLLSSIELPSGYRVFIKTPMSVIYAQTLQSLLPILALFLAISVLIILSINSVVLSINVPIDQLVLASNQLAAGNLSATVREEGNDELSTLSGAFNHMAQENKRLIQEILQRNLLENQLELQMLRLQINPHFLYNTLDSIRSTALDKQEPELAQMSFLLAQNLRYSVSQTTQAVSVSDEMKHLQSYIELQQLRYCERVHIELFIDPAMQHKKMLRLLLQPLVENALLHGIQPVTYGDSITILGSYENNCLVFRVTDNGVGIEPDRLQLLVDYLDGKNTAFTSIGLQNIQRRVQLYYGEEYGLQISSSPGHGTLVTLTIPDQINPEGAN